MTSSQRSPFHRGVLLLGVLSALALPGAARSQELPALASPALPGEALRVVPVDLSLVPPIDLNGDGPVLNHLSLGLAVARSTVLRGAALAPVHLAEEDVTGVQLTWAAGAAGGTVRGLQLTTIANVAGDLRGAQLAQLVNVVRGEARGVQLGGAVNWAQRIAGVQAGWGLNRAAGATGLQLATVNLAERLAGLQLAVVNVGGDVGGAQVGLVNVARRVRGLQLGVVNLADEADGAVGQLSLVRTGRHEVEVHATELSPLGAAVRLGGHRAHGLLVAGVRPGAERHTGKTRWTTGAGLGIGFEPAPRLALDLDVLAQAIHDDGRTAEAGLGTVRLVAAWRASQWLALFGGPTANLLVSDEARPDLHLGWSLGSGRREVRAWPGFVAGVRL